MQLYSQFYKGIGRSKYDVEGFESIVNCDIFTEPGSIRASYATALNSGATVTENIRDVVVLSDNTSFWFSADSGKIWKRSSAGVWSLVHTNINGACRGASYYNDYIYYASSTFLGRITSANAVSQATWSSHNDGWGTFAASHTNHPMIELNLKLFIGAGKYIASVNSAGTFSTTALDIPEGPIMTALEKWEADLIIGTAGGWGSTTVYRWDTYSDSWLTDDSLPFGGVNNFIRSDNRLLAQVGRQGEIFEYDGSKMHKVTVLRDENGITTQDATILNRGSAVHKGRPFIATKRGVFSFNRVDNGMPDALSIEYVATGGRTATIRCLADINNELFISWNSGTSYGVDKVGTDRATGTFITPIYKGQASVVEVKYKDLPTGTSIGIETKVDNGDWTAQTVINDTVNKIVYFNGGLGTTNTVQARITLNPTGTSTPVVEEVIIQ